MALAHEIETLRQCLSNLQVTHETLQRKYDDLSAKFAQMDEEYDDLSLKYLWEHRPAVRGADERPNLREQSMTEEELEERRRIKDFSREQEELMTSPKYNESEVEYLRRMNNFWEL